MALTSPTRFRRPIRLRPGFTAASTAIAGAGRAAPGIALCVAIALVSAALQSAEERLFGEVWLESLVLAILVGAALRTVWTPGARWRAGIEVSAKLLLEIAVALLGASVSAPMLLAAGLALPVGVAGVVTAAILASYGIGRGLGLPHRMALLVACGNSICGNSAIAAVAPVIGARGEDIAAAIGFTAVLGVVAVLLLPVLGGALGMSGLQYGALAGLTIYAVPQVLAAAAPLGPVAVQFGTLVKLVRVLMLGPVCFVLSLTTPRTAVAGRPKRPSAGALVPWFILGFLLLAAARSLDALPTVALPAMAETASLLTVVSMAALGLATDVRVVAKAGLRVTAAVTFSLLVLGAISLGLIHLLGLA